MAKKKTATATKPVSKTKVKTKPAAKRSAKPKANRSAKTSGQKATRKTAAKPKRTAVSSVDGILKSFEKERVSLSSNLVVARKKIEQMTKKIAALKTELENAKRDVVENELAIETLDSRRDKEIGALLSGLGVDLGKAAAAAKPKPQVDKGTPLFDKKPTDAAKEKASSDK
ncbi:hypothetical protein [Mariniblastus fucicola]|uniref:Uncharacterized protein n=1 Tax=Mariniblastus fucicola TaxID=980251 RepID=A0A5B9P7K6_9BACT|nr:hypothetical protein [Mariniblastus fucicola]QEG22627.1 hypothetical protein MFFC18_25100 [Mariniblastus fucicola]